jgi:hypothetical protein
MFVFDNYAGPGLAAAHDAMAITSACVIAQMPDDWPGKANEEGQLAKHYAAAKELDPKVPDPEVVAKAFARH